MVRVLRPALTLLAAAAIAAAEPAALPSAPAKATPVKGPQTIQLDAGEVRNVAKGRFFVSGDDGQSWSLVKEVPVDPAKPVAPAFTFAPPHDGVWLVVTAATWKNGTAEPDPKPGSIPPKHLRLLVDNQPPAIESFTVGALPLAGPDAPSASVTAAFTCRDANPVTCVVETSTDGGATFLPATDAGTTATGPVSTAFAVARSSPSVQVRVSARDIAGNVSVSPALTVVLPVPPDPEKTLAQAIANLPPLDTVQPAVSSTAASSTDGAPAAEPVSPVAAAIAAAPVPGDSTTRAVTAPGGRFLTDDAAQAELMQARTLRDGGDLDGALAKYLRLQRSDIADTATLDALAMLQGAGDHAAVVAIGEGLPRELRTDAVRVTLARSYLAFHRWADAEQAVQTIRKASPQARAGLLVFATAALGKGETARFTRITEYLAKGDDAVAAEARQLRGK